MAGLSLGLGLGLSGNGNRAPGISFGGSIAEGATTGRSAGTATLANPPVDIGTLTWSEIGTGTGAALFAINSSTGAVTNSAALDYETATSYTYGIQVTDGVYTYTRLATINVTNVLEVTLSALTGTFTLTSTDTAGTVAGAISGKSSGSTLALIDSGGAVADAGGRVAISGTNIVAGAANGVDGQSYSFTIRETHADGSNSPRYTTLSLSVSDTVPATAEIWLVAIESDSTGVGIQAREAGDTDWTGVYQYRSRAPTGISSDTTPLDQAIAPDGTSYLSPVEYFGKQRYTDTGLPIYLVPHAYNGSRIVGLSNTWGAGQVLHEDSIDRANAAIVAAIAATPGAQFKGFLVFGGTNDADLPAAVADWGTAIVASVDDARSRIFKDGVSGATVGTDATVIMQGILPEHRSGATNTFESKMLELMGTQTNYKYFRQAEGNSADGVHANNAGNRLNGVGLAGTLTDTTAPTITFPSTISIYANQLMEREIVTNEPAWLSLSGTGASSFEIVPLDDLNTPGNVASSRTRWYLRGAGGAAITAGTYTFTISAKSNGGTSTQSVTVTSVAAYGSTTETIVPAFTAAQQKGTGSNDVQGRRVFASFALKRGVNVITLNQTNGSGTGYTSLVASNGLVGVADVNNSGVQGAFYIYSAQDETVSLYLTYAGAAGDIFACGFNLVGTTATPTASAVAGFSSGSSTGSITCPASGIVIGGGISTSGYGPTSGQTDLTNPSALPVWGGYRTTTGALTNAGGACSAFGAAFAAA